MTFSAELSATDLAAASARAAQLVDTRVKIPILMNALLVMNEGRLEIAATNLDQSLRTAIPAHGEGRITVPAAQLAGAVARLDADKPVDLKLDGTRLVIKQGRARYALPVLPPEDYPAQITEPLTGQNWDVESAALLGRLDEIKGAMSTEGTRPLLEGIFFDLDADSPALAATDGNRLGLVDITDLAPPKVPGFIMPGGAIPILGDLAKLSARLTVTLGNGAVGFHVVAENRAEYVRTKLIDGQYPDYRRIIPQAPASRSAADAAGFARALSRVMVIQGDVIEGGRGKKRTNMVRLDFAAGEITVSARSQEGDAADACDSQRIAGDDGHIHANARYLAWAVESFRNADSLDIGFSDAKTPIVMTRAADAETRRSLRLIMPMRG